MRLGKDVKFLVQGHSELPTCCALRKLHKGNFPLLERPIMAGIGSMLHLIAHYIDQFLHPFILKIKTYIWDTKHFIWITEGRRVPSNAILVTLDVRALSSNISLAEARAVAESIFLKSQKQVPPSYFFFLIKLTKIALEHNYFHYGDQFFIKHRGAAMDSRVVPNIANLFMDTIILDSENFLLCFLLVPGVVFLC